MSVLNRSMFRRGYATGGLVGGIGGLEQSRRRTDEYGNPISLNPWTAGRQLGQRGLDSIVGPEYRGLPAVQPDMGQVFGRTQQMLADPRVAQGRDEFARQREAVSAMSNQELLAARESGQFDRSLVEREIESRGGYASPARRAAEAVTGGISSFLSDAGQAYRDTFRRAYETAGRPAEAIGQAFVPRFGDEEAPSFVDALAGRRARPAEPGTVPEGQRPDPAEAVREAPEEPPRPADPSPVQPIDTTGFPEPRPTDDPTAEQVAEATTPDGERLIDPVDPLMEAFERRGTMYEAVLGTPEERRQEARARIMFDVAQRALQFAGGVGAEGQPLRGSVMAQAAQAFGPSLGRVAEESAALQEQDQRVRLAQMQAAEQEVAAAAEAQRRAGESMQDFQQRLMLEQFRHELTAQPIAPLPGMPGFEEADDTPEGLAGWEEDLDMTAGFGAGAAMRNWINQALGVPGFRPPAQETDRAITSIQLFNSGLMNTLARDISDTGRVSNMVLGMVEQNLPEPGAFTRNPHRALNQYNAIRNRLESVMDATIREFNDPGTTEERRNVLRQDHHALRRSLSMVDAMRANLQAGTDRRRGTEADARAEAVRRAMMENQGGE